MKRLLSLVTLVLVTAALPILPRSADAQSVLVDPAVQAVATEIVNVTIVATQNVVVDGEAHTVATATVDASVSGETADTILVETPGGELPDGTVVRASHQPEFVPGDQVQVALVATPAEEAGPLLAGAAAEADLVVYSVVGGHDGAFWLSDDGGEALGPNDYSLMGTQWGGFTPAIPYKVNAAGSGLSAADTQAAVQRGFQTWEDDAGSDIDFTYAGASTATNPDLGDGINNISWVNTPNGADTWLAQALWFTDHNGKVLGFDIKFNTDYPWANGAQGGRYDIGTVTVHEAGHALGLGHVGVSTEVMYYSISPSGIKPLGAGDRNGVAHLYPYTAPGFVSPSSGATLACGSQNVQFNSGSLGVWHVRAGSTPQAWNYFSGNSATGTSITVTGLPSNGSPVHMSLWHLPSGGNWSLVDQVQYTACSPGFVSPTAGSTLACGSQNVQFGGGSSGVWHVRAGSTPQAWNYFAGNSSTGTSITVTGLPTNGSPVHLSLFRLPPGGTWTLIDQVQYKACG